MTIFIRPQSANNPQMMQMLKYHAMRMVNILTAHGVDIPDGTVKIWLKEHRSGKLFPKIEFDACGQELQYDITNEGDIKETHFKAFSTYAGPVMRQNLEKEEANLALQQIDTILQEFYRKEE